MLNIDNGDGDIQTVHQTSVCDGQWHSIEAMKAKNVVRLQIDGVQSTAGIGSALGVTRTSDPLYIGGVPGKYFQHSFDLQSSPFL